MYVQDILDQARLRLDDVVKTANGKYLWDDTELLVYYNETEKDFARRTRSLYDASTAAICSYDIFPGLPTLSHDRRIVEINSAYLGNAYRPLFKRSVKYFDTHIALWGWQSTGWRSVQEMPQYYIPNYEPHKIRFYPYYPLVYQGTIYGIQGASDISFSSSSNTITFAVGIVASMFVAGTTILVSGSKATPTNDGYYTVYSTPTNNVLTVSATIPATEANTSAFVARKIDTLSLEVARLPLADVLIQNTNTATPEIDEDYHLKMVNGILSLAYLKRDSETYNLQEATKFKGIWDDIVEAAKTDQIIGSETDEAFEPHYGAI